MSERLISRNPGVGGAVLFLQLVLGTAAFFSFFAAMFNGLEEMMLVVAVTGLAVNMAVSALVARKGVRSGVLAAVAFAGPALLFSLFSLGDALALGNPAPFLFWFGAAVVSIVTGLLGVLLVRRPGVAR